MQNLTIKQICLIGHSLGIDIFKAVMSPYKKDKQLPEEFYRNYFENSTNSSYYDDILELVKIGLVEHRKTTNFYHITEKGIEIFKEIFYAIALYTSKSKNTIEDLKRRINFYCDFYNYNFCDDNSKYVIEAYKEYWLKKYPVYHTTEDVIRRFEPELKKFYKNKIKELV